MRDVFIPTKNFQDFQRLCDDLLSTSVGVELGAVTGHAGRGKTTAAERLVSQDSRTIYVRYEEWMVSHAGLLREVCFRLAGTRPSRTDRCVRLIREELARGRKIILFDEADRLSLRQLNALRDLHDTCHVPIVLIGESPLLSSLERESRLSSRTRARLEFGALVQADLIAYYKLACGLELNRDLAPKLLQHSKGDFRRAVQDALAIERALKASGTSEITGGVVDAIIG